jgi:CheY-like chemotaxis protein
MTLNGKILIVDDHIDLAENVAEVLETAGYQTVVADSAEAALIRLERGDIAAIVTDYRLPGRNGAQLIREMRRRGRQIPAVVMSAYSDEETIAAARAAGAQEVLTKPVMIVQLLGLVAAFWS